MLFDPDRHEPLRAVAWGPDHVRETIGRIVDDFERNRTASGRWRSHPLDDEGETPGRECSSVYLGSAGVWWALWFLEQQRVVRLTADPAEGLRAAHAAYRFDPDTGEVVPPFFLGEAGILLALWRMTGSPAVADRLHASVASNIGNPTNEALWAAPGTMIAAWHMWQATSEPRWRALFIDNGDHVWRTWRFDPDARCYLWTQDMYGSVVQYLGAGHGFAGNVYPLLKGVAVLDAERRDELHRRCVDTLNTRAVRDGDAVNWPSGTFTPHPGSARMLVQWCHGAPGVVTALADFPRGVSAEMDALLLGAGRTVWNAGPLAKGYGLCHGTAGNGYGFLKLYRRTGDSLWLQRARAFAMHAIAQRHRMRE